MENLARAYQGAIQTHGHKVVELEFRIGRKGPAGIFQPGVPKASFERLMTTLTASKAFVKTTVSTHERMNGSDARYITTNGDDSSGTWMYKKKVCAETIEESIQIMESQGNLRPWRL